MPTRNLTQQQIIRRKIAGEPIHPEDNALVHRHVIAVHLENGVGALNRVANMFHQRGFNLESVTVGETEDPTISRLTLVTTGNDRIIAQVLRQLGNLIDVLRVEDLTNEEYVERELCLIRVKYNAGNRAEITNTADIFEGKVVDMTPDTMTLEVTGPTRKINALIGLMRPYGIVEVARSGRITMRRALVYGD